MANPFSAQMNEICESYDLEERAYRFAKRVRAFAKILPKTLANAEDCKQVIQGFWIRWSELH